MRDIIEGIAFDLDGTLYPNYRLNIRLLPFILKEWRFLSAFGKTRQIIRKEQETNFILHSDFYQYQAEILESVSKISGTRKSSQSNKNSAENIKEKADRLIYRGWEPLFKKIKLFKNVKETLSAFKKAGLKMGLLSDFPPETKLKYLNIDSYWDAVLCSECCGSLKPHPLSFIKLAQVMKLPCSSILYVGNSHPYDVAGAAAAGMKTAWIKSPFIPNNVKKRPKPDFSFHSYRQLHDFVLN